MDIIIMGVGGSLIFLAITWLCIRHNKKEIERNPDYKIQGIDEQLQNKKAIYQSFQHD